MLGIFEVTRDDGDSYLIDNFVVQKSDNFDDPFVPMYILFEGTQDECEQYVLSASYKGENYVVSLQSE